MAHVSYTYLALPRQEHEALPNTSKEDQGDTVEDGPTRQPFGKDGKADMHGEPEPLELDSTNQDDQGDKDEGERTIDDKVPRTSSPKPLGDEPSSKSTSSVKDDETSASPSTILDYLPSFLSGTNTPQDGEASKTKEKETKKQINKPSGPESDSQQLPPNPLHNRPNNRHSDSSPRGKKIHDYVKEHRPKSSSKDSTISVNSLRSLENNRIDTSFAEKEIFGLSQEKADERLPGLKDDEGEAPDILYNDDVVLDGVGYHQRKGSSSSSKESPAIDEKDEKSRLMAALSLEAKSDAPDTPQASQQRLRDNMQLGEGLSVEGGEGFIRFAKDLLASAGATKGSDLTVDGQTQKPESDVVWEIKRRLSDAQSSILQTEESDQVHELPSSSSRPGLRAGFDRGGSAPPEIQTDPTASAEYTWEWGGFPTKTPAAEIEDPMRQHASKDDQAAIRSKPSLSEFHNDPLKSASTSVVPQTEVEESPRRSNHLERQQSAPPLDKHGHPVDPNGASSQPAGKLKNDESDPYKFTLEMPGGSHIFELGLGGEAMISGDVDEAELHKVSDDF